MTKEDLKGLRPQVIKHHDLFVRYVKQYGSAVVAEVLSKGICGKYRLKVMTNRKDRYQMLQLLGLDKPAVVAGWAEMDLGGAK